MSNYYMTQKQRTAMYKRSNTMLKHSHDNLLALVSQQETEDIEEIKRIQPDLSHERALRVLALNKRINEANKKTEALVHSIDPRWNK